MKKEVDLLMNIEGGDKSISAANESQYLDLHWLFEYELGSLYRVEVSIEKMLPALLESTGSIELAAIFKTQLEQADKHIDALRIVFESIGVKARTGKSETMTGMVRDIEVMMGEIPKSIVRDAGIISMFQKIVHLKIAAYGTLYSFSRTMGEHVASAILKDLLDEEKKADQKYTELAEAFVNPEAGRSNRNMTGAADAESSIESLKSLKVITT